MSVIPGATGLEMRNDSHHKCERHWIVERGARGRRFARFEVVLKNTGLRRRTVDSRLVVVGHPAALSLFESEQRLVNCMVEERAAGRYWDAVARAADNDLPGRPATVRAAVTMRNKQTATGYWPDRQCS